MAKIRKRTEVTIETETLLVVRHGSDALRAWCEGCGAESLMLTPCDAAILAGATTRQIYARVEAGALHFNELPDGALLICGHSLGLNRP